MTKFSLSLLLLFSFGLLQAQNINPGDNNIIYVKYDVIGGTGDGTSWANAIKELADALKYAKQTETQWSASNPLQIWVAEGTYKPMYSPLTND